MAQYGRERQVPSLVLPSQSSFAPELTGGGSLESSSTSLVPLDALAGLEDDLELVARISGLRAKSAKAQANVSKISAAIKQCHGRREQEVARRQAARNQRRLALDRLLGGNDDTSQLSRSFASSCFHAWRCEAAQKRRLQRRLALALAAWRMATERQMHDREIVALKTRHASALEMQFAIEADQLQTSANELATQAAHHAAAMQEQEERLRHEYRDMLERLMTGHQEQNRLRMIVLRERSLSRRRTERAQKGRLVVLACEENPWDVYAQLLDSAGELAFVLHAWQQTVMSISHHRTADHTETRRVRRRAVAVAEHAARLMEMRKSGDDVASCREVFRGWVCASACACARRRAGHAAATATLLLLGPGQTDDDCAAGTTLRHQIDGGTLKTDAFEPIKRIVLISWRSALWGGWRGGVASLLSRGLCLGVACNLARLRMSEQPLLSEHTDQELKKNSFRSWQVLKEHTKILHGIQLNAACSSYSLRLLLGPWAVWSRMALAERCERLLDREAKAAAQECREMHQRLANKDAERDALRRQLLRIENSAEGKTNFACLVGDLLEKELLARCFHLWRTCTLRAHSLRHVILLCWRLVSLTFARRRRSTAVDRYIGRVVIAFDARRIHECLTLWSVAASATVLNRSCAESFEQERASHVSTLRTSRAAQRETMRVAFEAALGSQMKHRVWAGFLAWRSIAAQCRWKLIQSQLRGDEVAAASAAARSGAQALIQTTLDQLRAQSLVASWCLWSQWFATQRMRRLKAVHEMTLQEQQLDMQTQLEQAIAALARRRRALVDERVRALECVMSMQVFVALRSHALEESTLRRARSREQDAVAALDSQFRVLALQRDQDTQIRMRHLLEKASLQLLSTCMRCWRGECIAQVRLRMEARVRAAACSRWDRTLAWLGTHSDCVLVLSVTCLAAWRAISGRSAASSVAAHELAEEKARLASELAIERQRLAADVIDAKVSAAQEVSEAARRLSQLRGKCAHLLVVAGTTLTLCRQDRSAIACWEGWRSVCTKAVAERRTRILEARCQELEAILAKERRDRQKIEEDSSGKRNELLDALQCEADALRHRHAEMKARSRDLLSQLDAVTQRSSSPRQEHILSDTSNESTPREHSRSQPNTPRQEPKGTYGRSVERESRVGLHETLAALEKAAAGYQPILDSPAFGLRDDSTPDYSSGYNAQPSSLADMCAASQEPHTSLLEASSSAPPDVCARKTDSLNNSYHDPAPSGVCARQGLSSRANSLSISSENLFIEDLHEESQRLGCMPEPSLSASDPWIWSDASVPLCGVLALDEDDSPRGLSEICDGDVPFSGRFDFQYNVPLVESELEIVSPRRGPPAVCDAIVAGLQAWRTSEGHEGKKGFVDEGQLGWGELDFSLPLCDSPLWTAEANPRSSINYCSSELIFGGGVESLSLDSSYNQGAGSTFDGGCPSLSPPDSCNMSSGLQDDERTGAPAPPQVVVSPRRRQLTQNRTAAYDDGNCGHGAVSPSAAEAIRYRGAAGERDFAASTPGQYKSPLVPLLQLPCSATSSSSGSDFGGLQDRPWRSLEAPSAPMLLDATERHPYHAIGAWAAKGMAETALVALPPPRVRGSATGGPASLCYFAPAGTAAEPTALWPTSAPTVTPLYQTI